MTCQSVSCTVYPS